MTSTATVEKPLEGESLMIAGSIRPVRSIIKGDTALTVFAYVGCWFELVTSSGLV